MASSRWNFLCTKSAQRWEKNWNFCSIFYDVLHYFAFPAHKNDESKGDELNGSDCIHWACRLHVRTWQFDICILLSMASFQKSNSYSVMILEMCKQETMCPLKFENGTSAKIGGHFKFLTVHRFDKWHICIYFLKGKIFKFLKCWMRKGPFTLSFCACVSDDFPLMFADICHR